LSLCGEIRRQATTVKGIELITALSSAHFGSNAIKKLMIVDRSRKKVTTAHTLDEIPITIYHVSGKDFYAELFKKTGSEQHVAKVLSRLNGQESFHSEESIYKEAR